MCWSLIDTICHACITCGLNNLLRSTKQFALRCSFGFCRCYKHNDNRPTINEEHPQKLLNLTSEVPYPEGFLGYAVNLLHLNKNYVLTMDINGHGLRETLFFQLFSYLQVYATKSHMKNALKYIKTAAVSLDGGMIIYDKDMRDVELGCRYWFFFLKCRCLSRIIYTFLSKSMCWNLTV